MFGRKRIKQLEEKVERLNEAIAFLSTLADLEDKLQDILEHLGLEYTEVEAKPSYKKLVPKKKRPGRPRK